MAAKKKSETISTLPFKEMIESVAVMVLNVMNVDSSSRFEIDVLLVGFVEESERSFEFRRWWTLDWRSIYTNMYQ